MGKIGATLTVLGLAAVCLVGSVFFGNYLHPTPHKQGIKVMMNPTHGTVGSPVINGTGRVIKPGEK